MAAAKCPNINSKDWILMVRLFGLGNALYLYDAFDTIPNTFQIAQIFKREKGDELSDFNNPAVWDIEASEDLIARWRTDDKGKRIPVKRKFTTYKAAALIKEFRTKYPEATFSAIKVDVPGRTNTRIRVSVPFDISEPLYEQKDVSREQEIARKRRGALANIEYKGADEASGNLWYESTFEGDHFSEIGDKRDLIAQINEKYDIDLGTRQPKKIIDRREEGSLFDELDFEQRRVAPEGEPLTDAERKDFNRKKKIMMDTFPWVEQIIEDNTLVNLGQVENKGKTIRINPLKMSKDTIGHEFGHLLIDVIGGLNNPLVKSALKQLEDTPLAARIRKAYSDKTETVINKEIVAEAIGIETAKLFETEEKRSKWESLLVRLFEKFKKLLGIERKAVKRLSRMVLGKEEFEIIAPVEEEVYEKRDLPDYITEAKEKAKVEKKVEDVKTPEYLTRVREMEDVMGTLRNEIVDKLRTKIQIYERKGDDIGVVNLKRRVDEIEFAQSDLASLKRYISLAANQTAKIYANHRKAKEKYKKDKRAITAKDLQRWADYVSAFDALESVEVAIIEHFGGREAYDENVALASLKSMVQGAISRKNEIKSFLKSDGTEIVAEWLNPYVSRITAEYKLIYEREWRNLPRIKRSQISKDKYIQNKISANEDIIRTNTKHVLRAELKKGEFDIGYAYRMGETILDSDDVVIGSMAKAFALAMDRARHQGLAVRDKLIDQLRDLEKINPQTANMSAEKFYDFIIEKDKKGNYTNKLVGKFRSEFWTEYEAHKDKVEATLQETLISYQKLEGVTEDYRRFLIQQAQDIAEDANRTWRNANAPINKAEMSEARMLYMEKLLSENVLDEAEHAALVAAEEAGQYIDLDNFLGENQDAIDLLGKWNRENSWIYRYPITKWESPQYNELLKLGKNNPNDPRVKFHTLIQEISDEGDKYLPFRYRLKQSLPFMEKTTTDRLISGQGLLPTLKAKAGESFVGKWFDREKGQLDESGQVLELIDENNNPKMFLPVYYTPQKAKTAKEMAELVKIQSFDISTIYYNWYKMAVEYKEKNEILPEMELTKYLIENREVMKLDSKSNPMLNANEKLKDRHLTKSGQTSMLAAQLHDWFESVVYGKKSRAEGTWNIFGQEVDKAKTLDKLNRYTAFNLLGFNLMQGVANKFLGETMQIADMFAGQHYNKKDYLKATKQYNMNLAGILGDVGSRKPTNIVSLLMERFDVLHDYGDAEDFQKSTRFRQMLRSNTLFFMAKAGEHSMQGKAMLAVLNNMNAYSKEGNQLKNKDGSDMSLFDAFKVEKDKLIIDKNVDISEEQIDRIGHTMKRMLSRMHGEYSQLGRVALQRSALGRMAYMFRKFMLQGWKRRMEVSKRKNTDGTRTLKYNEVGEFFTEGNYVTTARFLKGLAKDWGVFKKEAWNANWADMTTMERANIYRTISEVIAFILIWTMANLVIKMEGDDDDDNLFLSHGIYQLLRLKAELAFFVNPLEAMKILRSPAASMSVFENVGRALSLLNPFDFQLDERFDGGPWDNRLKIEKYAVNAIPVYRQGKRLIDIENQINWFK